MTIHAEPDQHDHPPPSLADAPPDDYNSSATPIRRNGQRPARVPPHDLDAERAVLSACLGADMDTVDNAGPLEPADFYNVAHQNLWAAITTLRAQDVAPDVALVAAEPNVDRQTAIDLATVPLAYRSNVANYAARISAAAHQRRLIRLASELADAAHLTADVDVAAMVAKVERRVATTERIFVDLEPVLDGDTIGEPPAIGVRDDGACGMFYAGQLNSIIGESESGKSLLMQWWSAAELAKGNHVFWLDFEKDAATVVERLTQMGAARDAIIERFHYVRRDQAWTPGELMQLRADLAEHSPTLCVLDGVTNAMQLEGLDPNNAADVSKFYGGVPTILHSTGAASVVIDHVNKSRENRGPGASGSQHKRAGITGTSLEFRVKEPAGRGRTGVGFLIIDKDAPGYLRHHAVGGRAIADVTMRSDGESLSIAVEPSSMPEATRTPTGAFRPTLYMERVSKVLEGFADGTSKRTVRSAVTGRAALIDEAIAVLEAEGYVTSRRAGSALVLCSSRPYREAMDKADAPRAQAVSDADDLRMDDADEWEDQPF